MILNVSNNSEIIDLLHFFYVASLGDYWVE